VSNDGLLLFYRPLTVASIIDHIIDLVVVAAWLSSNQEQLIHLLKK
jgi:hypothetical protein